MQAALTGHDSASNLAADGAGDATRSGSWRTVARLPPPAGRNTPQSGPPRVDANVATTAACIDLGASLARRQQTIIDSHNLHGLHLYFRHPDLRAHYREAVVRIDRTPLVWLLGALPRSRRAERICRSESRVALPVIESFEAWDGGRRDPGGARLKR